MQDNAGGGILGMLCSMICPLVVFIVFAVPVLAGLWKMFEKMGKPGWAGIIPIYNLIIILEIVEKPIWWIVLLLIPCVQIVFGVLVFIEVAKKFGKEPIFGVGLAFLPFIFCPILGFGSAQYQGK